MTNKNIAVLDLFAQGKRHVAFNVALSESIHSALNQKINFYCNQNYYKQNLDYFNEAHVNLVQSYNVDVRKPYRLSFFISIWRFILAFLKINNQTKANNFFILETTPACIWATKIVNFFRFKKFNFYFLFHGELSTVKENKRVSPLLPQWLDYKYTISRINPRYTKIIVLEQHIKNNLTKLLPHLSESIQCLPHPTFYQDKPDAPLNKTGDNLSFGYFGTATLDKGFDRFLKLASQNHSQAKFKAITTDIKNIYKNDFSGKVKLAMGPLEKPLSYDDFYQTLTGCDFVILPFRYDYYQFAASGVMIDCMNMLIPMITLKNEYTENLFNQHGQIGYLCDNLEEMDRLIKQLTTTSCTQTEIFKENLKQARLDRNEQACGRQLTQIFNQEISPAHVN
ncbi:hypothetical protein [Catenovulum adriaticum]|uniref:Glycosyltransferase involved in cell wall biosynthesis n=1 Tax=Catenovulum adriaticum TaxID=2984846 RepID=A0ABY7APV3_9ALTE|nr:hypothetical protein [Catenovulum sp. TS8]WAJ70696.1 hypothetical protein OLW01_02455 [Catenovulum sp. TS8]